MHNACIYVATVIHLVCAYNATMHNTHAVILVSLTEQPNAAIVQ